MDDRKLLEAQKIAKSYGLNWMTLSPSTRENKRFMILGPGNKWIHFGLWPFKRYGTFLDHKNEKLRDAWQARHGKIMKDNRPAFMDPTSSEFYSWRILW